MTSRYRVFALLALLCLSAAAFADGVVILEPAAPLSDADRADLAARGVVIEQVLGERRYIAHVARGARVEGDVRLASMEPLTVEKKIHRGALREAASGKPFAELNVIFRSGIDFRDAHTAILAAGGTADFLAAGFLPTQRIEAKLPPAALHALAADTRVLTIAGPRRYAFGPDNEISARVSHVTELHEAPYGLSGRGVVVSLFESAPADAANVEFGGRLILENVPDGSGTNRQHATHVAGTIGAAGLRPSLKGMAPAVQIHQFCLPRSTNTCTEEWLSVKATRLKPLGIVADNNSWSPIVGWNGGNPPLWTGNEESWGGYDPVDTAPLDTISIDTRVLFVHSSGNDAGTPAVFTVDPWKSHRHTNEEGTPIPDQIFCVSQNGSGNDCPATCNGLPQRCEIGLHHPQSPFDTASLTGSAKNVLAVGAVNEQGVVAAFSSRGPAKDGRVKPDVVARGVNVLSTMPNGFFQVMSGTSMSAPAVTGIAALITEQWRRTNGGATPRPDQLKALILAGADDLETPGPDYSTGFGLANAKNAVDLVIADEGRGLRIRDLTFAAGQAQTHEIPFVLPQQRNVRVLLNWADPARIFLGDEEPSAKALVNDLDVRVIDPAGNVHLPWTLDKDHFTAGATRGVNTVDNVELIDIANAAPGTYRIVVTGSSVTVGPQTAVLVASAALPRPCFDLQEGEAAYGNLTSGAVIFGGLCSSGDVDLYKFVATRPGPVAVTITTGDTAVRATLTGTGISRTQEIPANTTATLNADANTAPNQVTLKLEVAGALGAEPRYSFTPVFGVKVPPKRRTARP